MPLFGPVDEVFGEWDRVVGGADDALEDVRIAARGLRALRSREVEEDRHVVALDEEHKLFTRSRERSVDELAREQPAVLWQDDEDLLELAALRLMDGERVRQLEGGV